MRTYTSCTFGDEESHMHPRLGRSTNSAAANCINLQNMHCVAVWLVIRYNMRTNHPTEQHRKWSKLILEKSCRGNNSMLSVHHSGRACPVKCEMTGRSKS